MSNRRKESDYDMTKVAKGIKYHCRVRKIRQEKIDKLYEKVNLQCQNCIHDCKNEVDNYNKCVNKKDAKYSLNEIIELLKDENINLLKLCNDNSLKLNILIEMLRSNKILSYKYYTVIMNRIGLVKNELEINSEYQQGKYFEGNIKQIANEDGVDI
jgi:hypothetical protein